ncbi:Zinc-type alcohol dehydrogenase protein [Rutstroemia sp. NJR-2017a BVV2]|nr:Zinc-type alcohol dehydrogenase protein [Rutstroemia sp. NJR-2017a BVV2]
MHIPSHIPALLSCPTIHQTLQLDLSIEYLYVLLSSLSVPRAVIRVHAAGIHSSDYFNALHDHPGGLKPMIPGRDYAGVIVHHETQPDLVGNAVYGSSGRELSLQRAGTHAGYVVMPEDCLVRKPENLSWIQAGAVGVPFCTAYVMCERARLCAGEVVLIFGATGFVGNAAGEIAAAKGCRVIRASRRDGVDVNISLDEELASVLDINGGKRPDVIFDCAGSAALMERGLEILGKGGRYIFISDMSDAVPEVKVDVGKILEMDQSISGVNSWNLDLIEVKRIMTNLTEMFEKGSIQAPLEESFTAVDLEGAVDIYPEVGKRGGKKYVITFEIEED